jgi:pimeloyl-ACP methyl ester carboxylesterase
MAGVAGIIAALGLVGAGRAEAQDAPVSDGFAGTWAGTLDVGGQILRLVFHVELDESGGLSGTMDSPDQGAFGLTLSAVEADSDGSVRFEFAMAGGAYTGRMLEDGTGIDGQWSQGGSSYPLALERTEDAPSAPERPQEPKPPYPYEAVDVEFDNPEAGNRLAGTLTVPTGEGPHPVVVLISGSGAQDRDEAVFGHRPFWILADHLTRRGIAVLRYDDRGVGGSTGDIAAATMTDFASDALAAVAYLVTRPETDEARIGLLGHSEGASIAAMAAHRSGDVAFVIHLAGMGVNGRELLEMQLIAINEALGVPKAVTRQRSELQKRLLDASAAAPDDASAAVQAREILAAAGVTGAAADAQVRALRTPWMNDFLVYDPLPALRELDVPVLALNGELDTQVPPAENLGPVERALREGGNPDFTVRELEGLNHLFQTADTGSPTEYVQIEETMAPAAMEVIADWIAERTELD